MGGADWKRRAWAVVASVIYAIACGVMTRWVARLTEDADALGTSASTHANEMRGMVERDCVERFGDVGGHVRAKRELRRLVLLIAPPAFYAQVRSPAAPFLPRPSLAFDGLL